MTSTIGEKKTVETWAEAKGMLPQWLTIKARVGRLETQSRKQNPRFVQFAIAKAHARWAEGTEVTEEEFDEAVAAATGITLA